MAHLFLVLHPSAMAHVIAFRARFQALLPFAGGLLLWWHSKSVFTLTLVGVTALLALLAWFSPRHYTPIQRVFDGLTRGLVTAVSWFLLATLYFGLFTPMRAFRALTRKDALDQRFDASAATYLRALPPGEPERFDRQF